MGHHVVDLIGLLGALARRHGALQAQAGIGGVDHLEYYQRVSPGGLLGIGTQPGALGDPGVLDLAAAAMVNQHAQRVLLVTVGKAQRQ